VRGWIVGLSISVALHAAVAAAAGLVLRGEPPLPPLIIDLSAIIAGHDEDAASREPAAEPHRAAPRSRPQHRTGRSSPPREPIAPRSLAATSREPAALPTEEAPPTPAAPEEPRTREAMPAPPITGPTTPQAPPSIAQAKPGADPRAAVRGDASGHPAPSADGAAGGTSGVQSSDKTASGRGDRVASLGGPGGGGPGSDYDAYYARLRQRLGEVLRSRYPSAARQLELRGTVHLEIDVEPSGAIGAVTVVTSSSHEILDRAAVNAVRSLSRVPFPSNVRPRALKVRLPVVFEVQ
jgi:periplasmic protein TonB